MSFPGSNLLTDAFALIDTNVIEYYQYNSRSLNRARQWVATYNAPIYVEASVQAVNRDTYVERGLDFQKNYVSIFVPIDVVDLARDVSGDQFVFDGVRYQVESQTTWFLRDGWAEVTAVEVKQEPSQ